MAQMIDRLWLKTQEGALKWNQLGSMTSYETRLGDFSIQLRGSPTVGLNRGVTLKVSKLDGTEVANVVTGNSLAALATGYTSVPPSAASVLEQLYKHVSSRDSDIDELLNLLK
jgi:hypothetical protein